MPAGYYVSVLYPIQDRAISVFRDTPFYLTGGTALSRGYFNHRYSDDLDYFLNYHSQFQRLAQEQIGRLGEQFAGVIDVDLRAEHFFRVFVGPERLKIEIINDVPAHAGAIVEHPFLGRIDSKENILSNKITAIVDRALPKDIVDAYFLLKDGVSLRDALTNADSKAAGIVPLYVAKILTEFDYGLLDQEIKWIVPVPAGIIRSFMTSIAHAVVKGTL
jgi:hypothetical protein